MINNSDTEVVMIPSRDPIQPDKLTPWSCSYDQGDSCKGSTFNKKRTLVFKSAHTDVHVYVTRDTESCNTDHKGRSVQYFLECVGTGTRIRRGQQGANSGGMKGQVVIVFIACVLWLGSGPCLNIVI